MNSLAELILSLSTIWMLGASLVGSLLVFVAATRGQAAAPILVMISVPVQRSIVLEIGSGSLTVTQMLLWAFLAGATLRFAQGRLRLRVDLVSILLSSLVLIYAISIVQSQNPGAWAGETYRWGSAALFLIVARSYFSAHSSQSVLWMLVGLCATAATWAVGQMLLDTGPASFNRNGLARAYGAFGEPNPFAAFCVAVSLPVIASVLLHTRLSLPSRLITICGAALGLFAVAATQSRGAILGIGAGCAFLALVWTFRHLPGMRVPIWAAGVLATAIAIVLVVDHRVWMADFSNVTPANWANAERQAHWSAAIAMIKENPVSGVGAGGFNDAFRTSTTEWRFRISQGHAHNAYLQVASEAGVFALVAYIGFLAAVVSSVWRRMRLDSCDWLRWGVLAVTLAMIVHQMFDYLQVLSLGILYGGLWAAVLGVHQVHLHVDEHGSVN